MRRRGVGCFFQTRNDDHLILRFVYDPRHGGAEASELVQKTALVWEVLQVQVALATQSEKTTAVGIQINNFFEKRRKCSLKKRF